MQKAQRKGARRLHAKTNEGLNMKCAIENDFPFEKLDPIAERESYRKEIYRPIYHIHKWWANRLGSVFRAITIGATVDYDKDIWEHFYKCNSEESKIIFDPFMGSGTTLGEALKLGHRAIGCDINPVSTFIVKQAFTNVDKQTLIDEFQRLEKKVSKQILSYYRTLDPDTGREIQALYYFWVKVVTTPSGEKIPLFNNYIFSRNAYPRKKPLSKILCPACNKILTDRYDSTRLKCEHCDSVFNPQKGPAEGQYIRDSKGVRFKIKDLIGRQSGPPLHRMYAVLAVKDDGTKVYLPVSKYDLDIYKHCQERLLRERLPIPTMKVRPGHNCDQARGYNYLYWKDFFNERQLLALGLLLKAVMEIKDNILQEQFLTLFSSTLEFNNLFCSYKGEGTGAVRHMFSHHILKPERTPLENTVWGTRYSSGTFSTLFKSRLLRAKEYLENPTEVWNGNSGQKKKTVSASLNPRLFEDFNTLSQSKDAGCLVLNDDSARVKIPDSSVDAIITDPPYFDFVHYSELSDFFFAWLSPVLKDRYKYFARKHSGNSQEVQDSCPKSFGESLSRVFTECRRVLKDEGVMVFSFHHSKPEGWLAIYDALTKAKFQIVAAHPTKAEMAVGSPKAVAKNPINVDALLVCRKIANDEIAKHIRITSQVKVEKYFERFRLAGRVLSSADRFVIRSSQLLVNSSRLKQSTDTVREMLRQCLEETENSVAGSKVQMISVNSGDVGGSEVAQGQLIAH